jgi:hypothetical protein
MRKANINKTNPIMVPIGRSTDCIIEDWLGRLSMGSCESVGVGMIVAGETVKERDLSQMTPSGGVDG